MVTAQHLCLSNEHYTPEYLINAVKSVFNGKIDTDPATNEKINLLRVKAKTYYTAETDGLKVQNKWNGNVFLNPPGGKASKNRSSQYMWFNEAYNRYIRNEFESMIFMGFNIEVLRLVSNLLTHEVICIPGSRIAYDRFDEETQTFVEQKSPPHSSVIIYLGNKEKNFEKEFRSVGAIWRLEPIKRF